MSIDHDNRICEIDGCNRLGHNTGAKKKDGTIIRRARCDRHHFRKLADNGYFPVPYLVHRKNYCENIDGRLGFVCTSTILNPIDNPELFGDDPNPTWNAMLQVDHIDGNPFNNDPKNLQTLCACCHIFKTHKEEDYKTPGRKAVA